MPKATFKVPALLNLTGELIQIGQTSYVKTSLTGDQYQKQESSDVPIDEATDPAESLDELQQFLDQPGVSPTKVADAKCGDNKDCYQVEIDLTSDELAALASEAPEMGAELGDANVKMTFGVEKDSLRMSKLVVSVNAGDTGALDVTVDLTKWDENVSISEPPADQVAG